MKVTNNGSGISESSRGVKGAGGPSAASGGKEKSRTHGPKTEIESSDKVNISTRARESAKAKEIAKAAPDVNEEKVAKLKAMIANGSYNVDAEKIADKLVDEHMVAGI